MTLDVARHFGLAADPFGPLGPDVVDSPALARALTELIARLDNGAKRLALEGAAGSGRTRLLRMAADALAARGRSVRLALHPREASPAPPADILLVDEADRLTPAQQAGLRARGGAVVLAVASGGAEGYASVAIAPLSPAESRAFLAEHVARAGGAPDLFAPAALDALAAAGEGSPRRLRRVAGLAMVEAALDGAEQVTERHAAAAIATAAQPLGRVATAAPPPAVAAPTSAAAAAGPAIPPPTAGRASSPHHPMSGRDSDRSAAHPSQPSTAAFAASAGPPSERRAVISDFDAPDAAAFARGAVPAQPRRPKRRSFAAAVALRTLALAVPAALALYFARPLLAERADPPAVAPPRPAAVNQAAPPATPAPTPTPELAAASTSGTAAPEDAPAAPPPVEAPAGLPSPPPPRSPIASTSTPDPEAAMARSNRRPARLAQVTPLPADPAETDFPRPAPLAQESEAYDTAAINRRQLERVDRAWEAVDRPRVVLHYSPYDADAAKDVAYALRSRGWHVVALRPVDRRVRRANARFFRQADAAAARRLAADLADELDGPADVRGMTRYTPAPAPGMLEVWLPTGTRG